MSLLREIQDAATEDGTSLANLLRKCQMLAARTNYPPLREWAERELNGYPSGIDVPSYRFVEGVSSSGTFADGLREVSNVPIPDAHIPDRIRTLMRAITLRDGVAAFEEMVRQSAGKPEMAMVEVWPPHIVQQMSAMFYKGMWLTSAQKELPVAHVAAVLDQIRSRVLSFSLDLETIRPDLGEGTAMTGQEKQRVGTVFQSVIYGGQQTFVSGGTVDQKVIVGVGDLDAVVSRALELGVPDDEVQALSEALTADAEDAPGEGQRALGWLANATKKRAGRTWQTVNKAAPEILAAVIKNYLPPI